MTDAPEYATLSPAARAYLEALTATEEAIESYVSCLSSQPHLKDMVSLQVVALRRAYWGLSPQEREEAERARDAHLRRFVQVLREAT